MHNHRESQRRYQKKIVGTEAFNARQRRYKARLREKVLLAYGNKCACCGETEPLFLEIDHLNNNGTEHRRTTPRFYQWLKKNNYPAGFQVLCCNCNRGKWRNGGICPHKTKVATEKAKKMKCPKCGKSLKILSHKGEKWLSHTYSFAHAMSDKPMCDYSKKIEVAK